MNILMSESLKERVTEDNVRNQILESDLVLDANTTRILKIERQNDKISIEIESDKGLLDKLYNYSIGLVNKVSISSQDLNMRSQELISYNVISCSIDYLNKTKKIKLALEVDN